MRTINTDGLPKWENGPNKGKIKWELSTGCDVAYQCDGESGVISIIGFDSKDRRIIAVVCGKKFSIKTSHLLNCKLSAIIGTRSSEHKHSVGETVNGKTIIGLTRKSGTKSYTYKCEKDGYVGEQTEGDFIRFGCPVCDNKIIVHGVNDITTTAPWMVKYFCGGNDEAKKYSCRSGRYADMKCPDCGRVKNTKIESLYRYRSICCVCSDGISYPNKFAYAVIDQINKLFGLDNLIREYAPDWAGGKRYDNYFEYCGKKIILEMDGALGHGRANKLTGESARQTKAADEHKDALAREMGISIVRIDCLFSDVNYIKRGFENSEIAKLFDLSTIDWALVDAFATCNAAKLACNIKLKNPLMTTAEIGSAIRFSESSVRKWLSRGAMFGLCAYDPKTERIRNGAKQGNLNKYAISEYHGANKKQVKCVDIGRIFKSATAASHEMGVSQSGISQCCTGRRGTAGGYKWEHVNDGDCQ